MLIRSAFAAARQVFSAPCASILWKSLALTIGASHSGLARADPAGRLVSSTAIAISASYPILDSFAFFLAGAGLFVALAYLLPVVSAIVAGYFLDDVAEVVERHGLSGRSPGRALPIGRAILYGLRFAGLSLLVNLAALLLFFIPGMNIAVFFIANAYLLGREYFELAAGRFRSLDEAARMRVDNRGTVFAAGAIIAALVMVPILNLLTPLFGAALMVHVHKRLGASRSSTIIPPTRGSLSEIRPLKHSRASGRAWRV